MYYACIALYSIYIFIQLSVDLISLIAIHDFVLSRGLASPHRSSLCLNPMHYRTSDKNLIRIFEVYHISVSRTLYIPSFPPYLFIYLFLLLISYTFDCVLRKFASPPIFPLIVSLTSIVYVLNLSKSSLLTPHCLPSC